jgi:hypothetical protein
MKFIIGYYLFFFFLFDKGPSYISPNQSYLYSYKRQQNQLKREHNKIMNVSLSYLDRIHCIPSTLPIAYQLLQQMEIYLNQQYKAPLSYKDLYITIK